MKLSQLLSIYPQLKWGSYRTDDVLKLSDDSRDIDRGSVFVAVKGNQSDGHNYIAHVCQAGAIGIIVEDESVVPPGYEGAIVHVKNSRSALNRLASRFYGEPAKNLFCIGVTGTNGKTSLSYMIEHMLNHYGWASGVMGTIDHHMGDHKWVTGLTTPGALPLQKRLSEFVALGAKAAVFEVSSHAIDQQRASNVDFDTVVFTNLSRDHLDYHKNMESYFQSKQKLFQEIIGQSTKKRLRAIINTDDDYGKRIQVADSVKTISYGQQSADYTFSIFDSSFAGSQINIKCPQGEGIMETIMPGLHNAYNLVAATAAAMTSGVSLDNCIEAMKTFKGVPGRLQSVDNSRGLFVFVDYAHTPEALESVLLNLQQLGKNAGKPFQIITVFGCGGDRDKGKRPLMMSAAKNNSDIVFLTSDNPRTEEPMSIINDALTVVSPAELKDNVFVDPDRRSAIKRALNMASEGTVVLIAGKGHEGYQIVGTEKLKFDDVQIVEEILSEQ